MTFKTFSASANRPLKKKKKKLGGTCFLLLNALYSHLDETFDKATSELSILQ